jgi:hypothetical protein
MYARTHARAAAAAHLHVAERVLRLAQAARERQRALPPLRIAAAARRGSGSRRSSGGAQCGKLAPRGVSGGNGLLGNATGGRGIRLRCDRS